MDDIGEDHVALFRDATIHNLPELLEVRADRRQGVFRLLAGCGVATAEVDYDGAGDEGCVGIVTARGAGGEVIQLPGEVEEAVSDFVSDSLPRGWEIDAGSGGTVTFDVSADRVSYSHYAAHRGHLRRVGGVMAHPYHHALSSVRKWGGTVEDYLPVYDWFDQSKAFHADFRHRALRHHAEGIFLAERLFGPTLTLTSDKVIPVRWVGEQHVKEDLGRIPSASDWLRCIRPEPWMGGRAERLSEEELAGGVADGPPAPVGRATKAA